MDGKKEQIQSLAFKTRADLFNLKVATAGLLELSSMAADRNQTEEQIKEQSDLIASAMEKIETILELSQ